MGEIILFLLGAIIVLLLLFCVIRLLLYGYAFLYRVFCEMKGKVVPVWVIRLLRQ